MSKVKELPIDADRVRSFSDGVLAIAITLLILDLHVPNLGSNPSNTQVWQALGDQLPNLFALSLSFYVIAGYWRAHLSLLKDVTVIDRRMTNYNLLFLFFIILNPFATSLISEYGNNALPTLLYAADVAAIGFTLTLMWDYLAKRPEFHAKSLSSLQIKEERTQSLIAPLIFSVSMLLAYPSPGIAKLFWISLTFVPNLVDRWLARAKTVNSG